MKTKTLENVPGLKEGESVVIWRMNHGFKSDLQGRTTKVVFDEKQRPTTIMDTAKSGLYFLVYGIYEAPSLGFNKIQDVGNELSDVEFNTRYKAARNLDSQTAESIQREVISMNAASNDVETIQKKSSSQSTEN